MLALLSPSDLEAREPRPSQPTRWTLPDALDHALTHSPWLQARRSEVALAEGDLLDARLPFNPELGFEIADRQGILESTTDHEIRLTQELEIAGQRRQRIIASNETVAAHEADWNRDRRQLLSEVRAAFVEALRARELLALAQADGALAAELASFSQRRLERGAAPQIEANLAQASAGRAERRVQQAHNRYAMACSRLAEVAGASPVDPPEPQGELALPAPVETSLPKLLELALEQRHDLRATNRQELAAEAEARLARADRWPNLVVGGFVGREESSDDLVGASVSLSLPLFRRNQGALTRAETRRQQLRHTRDALRLAIERQVTDAYQSLQTTRATAEHLRDTVLGTLEDNVDLVQRSFAAGRIGATEVVTLRQEFVASQQELIEVMADTWRAQIALELALGGPLPHPTVSAVSTGTLTAKESR